MTTSRRVLWDAEETAILVHAYTKVKSGLLFWNEAIKYVSNTLRERALRKGMYIGATLHNENGITMQMTKIEDLFSDGKFRLSSPPQVFVDVVNLYKKNRPAFNDLLQQAMGGSPLSTSPEKDFFQWLAKKVPDNLRQKLKNASLDLDRFFTTYKTLKTPLFDRDTINSTDTVKYAITSNDILRFIHKDKLPLMQTLIEFYCIYLNESQDSHTDEHEATTITPANLSPPPSVGNTVDLTEIKIDQYANTKPKQLYYFNDCHDVKRWNELYTQIARCIYKDFPQQLQGMIGKSLFGEDRRMDIGDDSCIYRMKSPKEITKGLYLETHLSATSTIRKIKRLLDLCNIDYKNITIVYTTLGKTSPLSEEAPVALPDLAEADNTPSPPSTESEAASDSVVTKEIVVQPSLSLGAYAFATDTPAAYRQTSRSDLSSSPMSPIDIDALPYAYSESRSRQEEHLL